MTDTNGAKTTPEGSGVPLWRRAVLAACNLGFLVVVFALAPWLARSLAGAGISWWIGVPILLVPLFAVDWLLRAVLLRPVRGGHGKSGAPAGRPPE